MKTPEDNSISAKEATSALVREIVRAFSTKRLLYLNLSPFKVFGDIAQYSELEVNNLDEIPDKSRFDLVVGDLPLGMGLSEWKSTDKQIKIRTQRNWIEIFKSLFHLNNHGIGLFLVEPHALRTNRGEKFRRELNSHGFHIKAIFNTPEKIHAPETFIQPAILLISKESAEKLFIAELLDSNQVNEVIHNLYFGVDTNNLSGGIFVDDSEFKSFYHFRISRQIERLETQYKEYDSYELSDVALEINSVRSGEKFEEKENAIYVPRIGTSQVVSCLDDARLKHHNYFQVILDDTVVRNKYAALFFSSAIGRLIIDSLSSRTFMPHVNKADLKNAIVAIPKLSEQEVIIGTYNKLSILKVAIDDFEQELSLSPTSSLAIRDSLVIMLDSLGMLTKSDRVRALIREGEAKRTEFKQTLSLDIKTQKKEKHIEISALKTVVAFLNTEGGSLLVGVTDNGEVCGIEEEITRFYKNNPDKILLHFKNLLKNKIGEQYYPYIDYRLVDVDGKSILVVDCKQSQIPCYLDEKDFYVRTNPATDKLEGRKLHEYVKQHFEK